MDVRVCGPNLTDQGRGTFHVHHAQCLDLNKYGPGRSMGGERRGEDEMLIPEATMWSVVRVCYSDQINEDATWPLNAGTYLQDFWFAPCCRNLPRGVEPASQHFSKKVDMPGLTGEYVYECFTGEPGSFIKLERTADVLNWVATRLIDDLQLHGAIHIVKHDKGEYR